MKATWISVILTLGVAAAGCGKSGVNSDVPAGAAPTVISREPAPGSTGVWVHAPIRVVFSKPILPASIDDTTVVVTGQGSVQLGKTLSLSADGTILTIELISSPAVPSTLTVTLNTGITDLHEQALILPGDTWSWSLPEWLVLGDPLTVDPATDANSPSIAINDGGVDSDVVLAWNQSVGADPSTIHVRRWTGSEWEALGGALDALPNATQAFQPVIMVGASGNPSVAWSESGEAGSGTHAYVRRWTGTAWEPLGSAVTAGGRQFSFGKSLVVLDEDPIIAFNENDGNVSNVHVFRWAGTFWQPLGGALSASEGNGTNALAPSLALTAADDPVVAWQESELGGGGFVRLRRWDGVAWQLIGDGNLEAIAGGSGAFSPSLALDAADDPVVAFNENDGTNSRTYVRNWNGSTWDELGASALTGPQTVSHTYFPVVGLDPSDRPTVAWYQEDTTAVHNVYLQRWSGTAWQPVGDGVLSAESGATDALFPTMVLDAWGSPVIAWSETDGTARRVHVWRYNQ